VHHLSNEDVDSLFKRTNVLILLYKRRVGPSGVFSRAVSCGLPTIMNVDGKFVTAYSPLPAILIEQYGLVNKAKMVAEAMIKLKDDELFLKKLLEAMLEYKRDYSFQKTTKKYEEIFLLLQG
jgi:glycosyltransferase involved in cell wall biosynthesis